MYKRKIAIDTIKNAKVRLMIMQEETIFSLKTYTFARYFNIMMRKFCLALAISSATILVSCTPKTKEVPCADLTVKASSSDSLVLANYITDKGIEATYDPRGFYYKIPTEGNTNRAGYCGKVTINYTGKLTNGHQFDSRNGANFSLDNLVSGLRYGINLIGEGGKAKFYLPPSLAYGNDDYQAIPGGSILIFEVDLVSINK